MEGVDCTNVNVTPIYSTFRWVNHSSYVLNQLRLLLGPAGVFKNDINIACDGGLVECNKILLAVSSHYFAEAFMMKPIDQTTLIQLPKISVKIFRYIYQYMYDGKITLPVDQVNSFVQAGHELKVEGLRSIVLTNSKATSSNDNATGMTNKEAPPPQTTNGLDVIPSAFVLKKIKSCTEPNENYQTCPRTAALEQVESMSILSSQLETGNLVSIADKASFVLEPSSCIKAKGNNFSGLDVTDGNESCVSSDQIRKPYVASVSEKRKVPSKENNREEDALGIVSHESQQNESSRNEDDKKTSKKKRVTISCSYSDDYDSDTKEEPDSRDVCTTKKNNNITRKFFNLKKQNEDPDYPKPSSSTWATIRRQRGSILWNGKYYTRKTANEKDIFCPDCYRGLKLANLEVHRAKNCKKKTSAKKGSKHLKCDFDDCQFISADPDAIEKHMETHQTEYLCTKCRRKYASKESYDLHKVDCKPLGEVSA